MYGIDISEDGQMTTLKMLSAMIGMNNFVIGGVPIEECVPLDDWTAEQKERLVSGLYPRPDIFLDPLGFSLLTNTDDDE